MALAINNFPAAPECGGTQWVVTDQDTLATLVGSVLIGRAHHAARVLEGAQHNAVDTSIAQRNALRAQLHPANDATKWHRDGLLFEIICWLAAKMSGGPNDLVSDPHLSSTQQGADTIRIRFDPGARTLTLATICEQKCTTDPRGHFRDSVIPAFKDWIGGKRDNQLVQMAIGLLSAFNLTDDERTAVFDKLVQERPFAFRAALTVTPSPFATARCVAVFKDYQGLTPIVDNRNGDTFPLADIRQWFNEFAQLVWEKIEAENV
jgi:hypothetical protein